MPSFHLSQPSMPSDNLSLTGFQDLFFEADDLHQFRASDSDYNCSSDSDNDEESDMSLLEGPDRLRGEQKNVCMTLK